jgi:hypothetical protein
MRRIGKSVGNMFERKKLGVGTSPNLRCWTPFQQLPGLVALWPMQNSSPLLDIYGGHNLTKHGNATFTQTAQGGLYLDKVAADFYDAADATWNSITGALFIAGWVQHDAAAAAQETYLSKYVVTGNKRTFVFRRQASGQLNISASVDGTAVLGLDSGAGNVIGTSWTFVAGRFVPSTKFSVWINNTRVDAVTALASIVDSDAALELGSWIGGTGGMVGNMGVFGMYNQAPSDAAVTALYNATARFYENP